MKTLTSIILILILTSCGLKKEDENDIAEFYETNYEFVISQKHLYRTYIEKYLAERAYFSNESLFDDFKTLDSLSISLINSIDSCITNETYNNSEQIISTYSYILEKIDSNVENDKNYMVKEFDFNNSKIGSKLKYLRIKNDVALAVTKYLDYTYTFLNTSCGFNAFGNISSTSRFDSNGTTIITLQSDYKKPQMQYGNMILEDLKSDNGTLVKDCHLKENRSFYDIEYKNLKPGNYSFKGKMRYYTKKGIKDYPFEHKFEVVNKK